MSTSKKQATINKLILILILSAALSAIYIHANNSPQVALNETNLNQNKKALTEQENILNCAKKIANNKDIIAQNTDSNDCMFQGCGDFFQ